MKKYEKEYLLKKEQEAQLEDPVQRLTVIGIFSCGGGVGWSVFLGDGVGDGLVIKTPKAEQCSQWPHVT